MMEEYYQEGNIIGSVRMAYVQVSIIIVMVDHKQLVTTDFWKWTTTRCRGIFLLPESQHEHKANENSCEHILIDNWMLLNNSGVFRTLMKNLMGSHENSFDLIRTQKLKGWWKNLMSAHETLGDSQNLIRFLIEFHEIFVLMRNFAIGN